MRLASGLVGASDRVGASGLVGASDRVGASGRAGEPDPGRAGPVPGRGVRPVPPSQRERRRACRRQSKRSSTRARPFLASAAVSRLPAARSARASARAPTSPGSSRIPVTPSWTTSGRPDTEVATTGVPQAIASSTTVGRPSILPSSASTQGATRTSARPSRSRTSAWVRAPRKVTVPSRPASRTLSWRGARSSPSPATVTWASTPRRRRLAAASTRSPNPFLGTSRPTPRTRSGRSGPGAGRARKGKRSSSRALYCRLTRAPLPSRTRSRKSRLKRLMAMTRSASPHTRRSQVRSTSRW